MYKVGEGMVYPLTLFSIALQLMGKGENVFLPTNNVPVVLALAQYTGNNGNLSVSP